MTHRSRPFFCRFSTSSSYCCQQMMTNFILLISCFIPTYETSNTLPWSIPYHLQPKPKIKPLEALNLLQCHAKTIAPISKNYKQTRQSSRSACKLDKKRSVRCKERLWWISKYLGYPSCQLKDLEAPISADVHSHGHVITSGFKQSSMDLI
jgi:hypothetical protein